MRKKTASLLLAWLLMMCAAASAELYTDRLPREDWYKRPLLRLTAFRTGESDCMLLECGGQYMMVDAGMASYRDPLIRALEEYGISRFKYLFNTHYHEDHIGGMRWLMQHGFEVGVYLHPYTDYAAQIIYRHRDTIREAERQSIPIRQVSAGDTLLLGEAVIHLMRYEDGATTNARSTVARVEFGGASLLLTADIVGETQNWMLKNVPPEWLDADILKAPHHGITAMVPAFLEAVSPQALLINNDYDRVDKGRVQAENYGLPAYYSGEGRVVFETDGADWYVYQKLNEF